MGKGKITVYKIRIDSSQECVFEKTDNVLEDVRTFLEESDAPSELTIKVDKMTRKAIDDLGDFEGY